MIVYKLTDGFAHDMRYAEDDHVLQPGELAIAGFGELPALETLHDPLAVKAKLDAEEAVRTLFNLLRPPDAKQISNYVDANVTDLASARVMITRLVLVLALIANER